MTVKKVSLANRKRTSDLGDGEAVAAKKAELKAMQAEINLDPAPSLQPEKKTPPRSSKKPEPDTLTQLILYYQTLKSTGTPQRRQYNDRDIQKQLIQSLRTCVNQKAEEHAHQGIEFAENQLLCQQYLDALCQSLAEKGLPKLRLKLYPNT